MTTLHLKWGNQCSCHSPSCYYDDVMCLLFSGSSEHSPVHTKRYAEKSLHCIGKYIFQHTFRGWPHNTSEAHDWLVSNSFIIVWPLTKCWLCFCTSSRSNNILKRVSLVHHESCQMFIDMEAVDNIQEMPTQRANVEKPWMTAGK